MLVEIGTLYWRVPANEDYSLCSQRFKGDLGTLAERVPRARGRRLTGRVGGAPVSGRRTGRACISRQSRHDRRALSSYACPRCLIRQGLGLPGSTVALCTSGDHPRAPTNLGASSDPPGLRPAAPLPTRPRQSAHPRSPRSPNRRSSRNPNPSRARSVQAPETAPPGSQPAAASSPAAS
jgi:hypothetical protein